jgi:hypothetical protein
MDQDGPEKRIADVKRKVAAPRTPREAQKERNRERRASWIRVRDEAGVNAAQSGPTQRFLGRTLAVLGLSGIPVFIVGLVLPHTTSWIWIGGLALFFGGFVPIFAWIGADNRKVEKIRWREGTVTFRRVKIRRYLGEDGWDLDCQVELNPTGRITWVNTTFHASPPAAHFTLEMRGIVVGATMRCLIDRTERVVFRVYPSSTPYSKMDFLEGKS